MFIKDLEAIVAKCLDYDGTLGIDWAEEKALGYWACMNQVEESICSWPLINLSNHAPMLLLSTFAVLFPYTCLIYFCTANEKDNRGNI